MISYKTAYNISTQIKVFKYPDGCVDIDLNVGSQDPCYEKTFIEMHVHFGDDMSINDTLIAISLAREALCHQFPMANIALFMPYIPYARQDRRERTGMAHPLKQVGRFINNLEFAYVMVADPHSTVAESCIDRLRYITQFEIFGSVKQSWREVYIVAPDAGATKKCEVFAKQVGAAGVITCAKDRVNGKVQGIKVLDTVPLGAKLFVLDDLADGGRTFIEVAKELGILAYADLQIELAVTHGLFTKGVDVVASYFDHVYTTNSYISNKNAENVTVIELK